MKPEQRQALYAWIELVGQYGGQDGQRIDYYVEQDNTLTVHEEGLMRDGGELVVSGAAEVTIDEDGIVRTMGGHIVNVSVSLT